MYYICHLIHFTNFQNNCIYQKSTDLSKGVFSSTKIHILKTLVISIPKILMAYVSEDSYTISSVDISTFFSYQIT